MEYQAILTKEGRRTLVEFPDCPGCQTFAEPGQDIEVIAREALEGWLEACLLGRTTPTKPKRRTRAARGSLVPIAIGADLSLKLELRWARLDAGLSQAELATRAGVSQQMIAKLEHPDYHPRLDALDAVAKVLGKRLAVRLENAA